MGKVLPHQPDCDEVALKKIWLNIYLLWLAVVIALGAAATWIHTRGWRSWSRILALCGALLCLPALSIIITVEELGNALFAQPGISCPAGTFPESSRTPGF